MDASNPLGVKPDKIRIPLAVSVARSSRLNSSSTQWCATWPDTPNDDDVLMCFGGQKGKPEYSSGLFWRVPDDNYVCEPFNLFPHGANPSPWSVVLLPKVLYLEVDAPDIYDPATTNGPEDLTDDQIVFFHEFVHLDLSQALNSIWVSDPPFAHNPPLSFHHSRRLDTHGGFAHYNGMGPDFVEYIYN